METNNTKKWYQSKTIWAAVVNGLATLFLILDIQIDAIEIEKLIALVVEVVSLVGVFYGRVSATRPIINNDGDI